ncbi:MAG: hypothetical protein MJZ51_02950 [Bacteroidales bacterium]|nr:hypothetical protein [Bacteroidales bacterium]
MQIQTNHVLTKMSCSLFLLLSICMLVCCSEDKIASDLRFSVSISRVESFSVAVTVTHTGTNRDIYHAFVVEGDVDDIYSEIAKHYVNNGNQITSDVSYDQKKRVVKLHGLFPDTDYTFIVYGVDDSGNIKGTPAKVSFRTTSSAIVFEKTDKWIISYQGQDKYNGKTYSKITIRVQGDVEERYFVRVFNKQEVDTYTDTRSLILRAYGDFYNDRNETENEDFWIEDTFVGVGSMNYYKYLTKGIYQIYVIGVDAMGCLTGNYACSEEFEFDKYELEPEYEYLLGNWKITDGVGKSIFITLSEKWANCMLTMSGWGNNDCPLTMHYDPSGAYLLSIPGQSAVGSAGSEGTSTTMTMRPWYLNKDGEFRIYISSIVMTLACSKGKNENGSFIFSRGFNIILDNGEYASTNGIILTFYDEERDLNYFKSSKIQLPFTMRKIE